VTVDSITAHPRFLVFGASGYVGTNLVPALLAAGNGSVRAAARNSKVLAARSSSSKPTP